MSDDLHTSLFSIVLDCSGNYDEGFGREQRKADWIKKDAKPVGEEEDAPVTNGNQSGGEE